VAGGIDQGEKETRKNAVDGGDDRRARDHRPYQNHSPYPESVADRTGYGEVLVDVSESIKRTGLSRPVSIMSDNKAANALADFSLVKGGLVYQLFRWTGLCDAELEPAYRRIIVVTCVAWLPLLLLSLIDGRAYTGANITFLSDVENHVRFLVALPFLLAGETLIQQLLSPRIKNFLTRNIVRESDMAQFRAAIDSAHKMRDSATIEIGLIVLVYAIGAFFYGNVVASASTATSTWYANPDAGGWNLSPAGYWLRFVSLPIFQFFILRWYFRIVIWFAFLRRVSRLDLNLMATHSDRVAGIGFLNKCAYSFSYGLIAQGFLLSGFIAGKVMHFGGDPRNFKVEAAGLLILGVGSVLAPLAVFGPKLITAKWEGGGKFGVLASRYVMSFDDKWIKGRPPENEELLGTSDLQSLADLGNSYSVISQMRTLPFSASDVMYLVGMVLVPLLPLLLFIFSLEELVERLVKVLM
jgi:hypothetical protein